MLTPQQIRAYDRDGFLAIPGFASPATCAELMAAADRLVDGFDTDSVRSVFSTTDQARTSDAYFLASGDQIRFFFEEGAFTPDGLLKQAKQLSINKIGHALHDRDPAFSRFSHDPRLAAIAADIGLADPVLIQSMYIFKQPRIGGEVVCHQDSTYLHTEPLSVVGFWLALQDATTANGCMWALPGGHRTTLRKRFHRNGQGGVAFEMLDPSPFPSQGEVALEAKAGTLILLHGLLPHRSGPNLSDRSRHAYTLHVIDGACRYSEDNWLQRPADDPARGFV